ncbi:MAG: P-type conjugative transfer protein TrbL [Alphaproteobacteria bacterium]|nr:P-type conjugative transfer protein TrbL [Alphaproteobacteria bacterium]
MTDFSAIDGFLATFSTYIDSGFGLISGDVTSLAASLIVIDVTLAALFWAWGANTDIIQSLIRKTLYVGAFAWLMGNFAMLSGVIFDSFARLGLKASAASFGAETLARPGVVASEGLSASKPIFDHINVIAPGPIEFFANLPEVILLLIAGLLVMAAFFILSIQLFVLIVEFKLTTLAGFVLVPFAFWRQTTFLAERVLGGVVAAGVKVLVIAIVIGIGSGLFATLRTSLGSADMTIDQAFAVVLGALTLMGLSIFCPGLAAGLISGAPQLSAGAAAGTTLGVVAASGGGLIAGQTLGGALARSARAGTAATIASAGGLREAARLGALRTGLGGPYAAPLNAAVGLSAAAAGGMRQAAGALASRFRASASSGARAVAAAAQGAAAPASKGGAGASPPPANDGQPGWANRFRKAQGLRDAVQIAAQTIARGDAHAASQGPDLKQPKE